MCITLDDFEKVPGPDGNVIRLQPERHVQPGVRVF